MIDPQSVQAVPRLPDWFEWLTVASIIAGPILALLAQRVLDGWREKRNAQRRLYFTLMSTRAVFLSQEHVQALNTIDVVFARQKNIRDLWRKVLDHVATRDRAGVGWDEKLDTLRVDLYQAIGNKLGYRYTTDYIKRGIYLPELHSKQIAHQNAVLEGFAQALEGGTLRVSVTEEQAPPHVRP